jgi:hypothetical protein
VQQPQTRLQRCAAATDYTTEMCSSHRLDYRDVRGLLQRMKLYSCYRSDNTAAQMIKRAVNRTVELLQVRLHSTYVGGCLQNRLHSNAFARERPTEL